MGEGKERVKVLGIARSSAEARRHEAEILLLQMLGTAPGLPCYRDDGFTALGERFVVYCEVPGRPLCHFTQGGGETSVPVNGMPLGWLAFVRRLLHCVSGLHDRGNPIFHGDISAGNVILSSAGDVGLVDFGVSRSRGVPFALRFSSRQSVAAPRYMSPEQARGAFWGSASDIYQVGLVTLELLHCKPVNEALTVKEILVRLRHFPAYAQQLAGREKGEAGRFLSLLLDPNPYRRPSACEALSMLV